MANPPTKALVGEALRPGPRPRGDRHQVRLRHRRRRAAGGPEQPARAYPPPSPMPSLQRLGTERIDLFYQHRVDPDVPIEEVAGAVRDLIAAGQGQAFRSLRAGPQKRCAARTRCSPLTAAIQNEYSLWTRGAETRRACSRSRGAGHRLRPVQPARPRLPHRRDRPGPPSRRRATCRSRLPRFTPEATAKNQALVDLLKRHRRGQGRDASLRSPSPGSSRRSHGSCRSRERTKLHRLEENLGAAAEILNARGSCRHRGRAGRDRYRGRALSRPADASQQTASDWRSLCSSSTPERRAPSPLQEKPTTKLNRSGSPAFAERAGRLVHRLGAHRSAHDRAGAAHMARRASLSSPARALPGTPIRSARRSSSLRGWAGPSARVKRLSRSVRAT